MKAKINENVLRSSPDEGGATIIEYAFVLALVALLCFVALGSIGTGTSDNYEPVRSILN